ncbi:MAG: YceI family protein, partial [Candidatus Eremiobacteraeota bacterium]|nr:YceI family protein [Candidatus Eremiobacteraeota bacterium]
FDVTKLTTQNDRRDSELRGPDWFDAARYPTMTFVMRSISGTPQAFTMTGDLTLHGQTKPITIAGKLDGTMTDARGHRHVAYEGTATFDRRNWGMTWGSTMGGALIAAYDVTVEVVVDAVSGG